MTGITMKRKPQTATKVDRELESISRHILVGQASQKEKNRFDELLHVRTNAMLNLPRLPRMPRSLQRKAG